MEPNEIAALAKRIHDAEGWNLGANSTREYRNEKWAFVVGVVHHGHPTYNPTPDPRWHLKSGGGGRPQSDDVAVRMPDRHFWDFIGGVGADGYTFGASGDHGPLPMEQPVFPPPVPDGGGVTQPPAATLSEYWTPAHDAIRQRMAGRPVVELAQQLAHSFPAEGWGEKRTTSGDWSRDTIGRLVDGRLWAVKVSPWTVYGFLGSGHVHRPVSPVNHLGDAPKPEPPPVEPPPVVTPPPVPAVDYGPRFDEIAAAIAALAVQVTTLQATAEALRTQEFVVAGKVPIYGNVNLTIKPKATS